MPQDTDSASPPVRPAVAAYINGADRRITGERLGKLTRRNARRMEEVAPSIDVCASRAQHSFAALFRELAPAGSRYDCLTAHPGCTGRRRVPVR